jgi:hypothetical protein
VDVRRRRVKNKIVVQRSPEQPTETVRDTVRRTEADGHSEEPMTHSRRVFSVPVSDLARSPVHPWRQKDRTPRGMSDVARNSF